LKVKIVKFAHTHLISLSIHKSSQKAVIADFSLGPGGAKTPLATKIAGAKEAVVQTPALQDNERGEERAEARKGRTTSVKVEGCAAMRTSFPHKPSPAARDRFQGSVLGERRAYLKAFQDRTSDDHSCRYSFSISYAGRWTYWRRTRGARLLYASGARISICGARMRSVPLLQLTFGCWRRAAHEMMELVQVLPALVHFLLAVCVCTVFSCAVFIVFAFFVSSVTKARRRTS
jgi:hypothetical protein